VPERDTQRSNFEGRPPTIVTGRFGSPSLEYEGKGLSLEEEGAMTDRLWSIEDIVTLVELGYFGLAQIQTETPHNWGQLTRGGQLDDRYRFYAQVGQQ
jgi:hypothetical protein